MLKCNFNKVPKQSWFERKLFFLFPLLVFLLPHNRGEKKTQLFWSRSMSLKNNVRTLVLAEAVFPRCSVKKVFLEVSQNSQENTCARVSFFCENFETVFLLSVQKQPPALSEASSFIKKRLWHRCFPVNFAKFLRAPLLK